MNNQDIEELMDRLIGASSDEDANLPEGTCWLVCEKILERNLSDEEIWDDGGCSHSKLTDMIFTEAIVELQGCKNIQSGVYLCTSEYMTAEQEQWDEDDLSKDIDFSSHKFWITTDSGTMAKGFDNIKDAIESL